MAPVLGARYPELRDWAATVLEELRTNERTVFEVRHLADEMLDRNTNLMTTRVDHFVSPFQHEIANQLGGELVSAREARWNLIRTGEVVLADEVTEVIWQLGSGGQLGAELAGLLDAKSKKRR